MVADRADIIAKLRKEILPFQGFGRGAGSGLLNSKIGAIKNAFPAGMFPLGAVHEFIAATQEDGAATIGFIAVILAALMQDGSPALWIGPPPSVFPPALKSYGIMPHRLVFIHPKKETDILWTIEEALKCKGIAGVVGEIKNLDFTVSRRLQLAVEKSRSTGFVIRRDMRPAVLGTTACIARWKIAPLPGQSAEALPGVGFPRWKVELLKARNGRPGNWEVEFRQGRLWHNRQVPIIGTVPKKQTG